MLGKTRNRGIWYHVSEMCVCGNASFRFLRSLRRTSFRRTLLKCEDLFSGPSLEVPTWPSQDRMKFHDEEFGSEVHAPDFSVSLRPKSQDPQFRVFDWDLWSALLNNGSSSICNLMWTLNWGLLSSGPCVDRLFQLRGPALGCAWKWIRVKQLLLTWMLLVRLDCFFKSWNHFLHWNVPFYWVYSIGNFAIALIAIEFSSCGM